MMAPLKPIVLLILDGFGHREDGADNATLLAKTPQLTALKSRYAYGTIQASESFVGLPSGQFGNSEVGHLNIGAGRVVAQDISRIDVAIETGDFANNAILKQAFAQLTSAPENSSNTLHVLGLLSDGGVHSHQAHLHAVLAAAHAAGIKRVAVHAFLDGRDTPPRSASKYLQALETLLERYPNTQLASVCGRYWIMDRDNRWERMQTPCQLLVEGRAPLQAATGLAALAAAYARDENDEFCQATQIGAGVPMQDGDVLVFTHFRADRARQLVTVLTDPDFAGFEIRQPKFADFVSFTNYGDAYAQVSVMYPSVTIKQGLGEYLSMQGKRQLRMAETEKYPHVTYFFNGGVEAPYAGEERIMVPSPKVSTYDLQPEMNAPQLTEKLIDAIKSNCFDVIICNYANGDMVGHTGNLEAAILAVEALDRCVGEVVAATLAQGGEVVITADHGNCERMYDEKSHQAHTQHTTEQVPFLYVGRAASIKSGGALKDIAPSLLSLMSLPIPTEMTGTSLIEFLP